jgi:hypothetical protein
MKDKKVISPAFIFSTTSAAFSCIFADILMFLDIILLLERKTERSNAIKQGDKPRKTRKSPFSRPKKKCK